MDQAISSKAAAGARAAALVADGMHLGLGTGSTVSHFLDALAGRVRAEGLKVSGVPTSEATATRARELGLAITSLDEVQVLDLVVDGADEVDLEFRLVKGGGGALLREKIVAAAGKRVAIIVGEGKRVARLGTTFLLPVEILPFGHRVTTAKVAACGCLPFLRRTEGDRPFVTDNGNWILDCKFAEGIEKPEALHAQVSQIPGVAEIGLFLGLCDVLIVGGHDGQAKIYQKNA
ncbi:MAG TPA: ribose-5-phosphate isomerase RpiA [Planctomycetota bacterium]